VCSESKPIAVWVQQGHFSRTPRRVRWGLEANYTAAYELAKQLVNVWNLKVNSSTNVAIASVLGEEYGLAGSSKLQKQGKPWLELVLPIYGKAHALLVERLTNCRAKHAKLRDNCLGH
jgi:hypothetical protein